MEILIRTLIAAVLLALLYKVIMFLGYYLKSMFAVLDAAESTETGFVIFDDRGKPEFSNAIARNAIPAFRDGSVTMNLSQFLAYIQDCAQSVDQSLQQVLLKDTDADNETSFREFVCFESDKLFLVKMSKIKGNRILFLLIDISKTKYREEKFQNLNKNIHQLLQAFEATTCGVIVSDPNQPNNPVIFANDAVCDFLGLNHQSIMSGGWDIIINALEAQEAREKLLLAVLNSEDIEVETQVVNAETPRWLSLKFNPVEDDIGNLELYICIFNDITLLKQRENEVVQSQKLEALGKLAAGIAHDFNNVLSIVDGYSVMAEKLVQADPEKTKSYLRKISASAKRGAGLTQKMLTFSRHKMVSKNVMNLREVMKENKAFLAPIIDVSILFEMDLPEPTLNIKGTPDAMGQILINLCINARDAMPNGGNLIVQTMRVEPEMLPESIQTKIQGTEIVKIMVSDTGEGMEAKIIERIFDPFFTTKPQGKGTGLGLSVVYGLVKEMGGAIDVRSTVGRGTDISIYLPVTSENPSKMVMIDPDKVNSISLEGFTALVVEDEKELLRAVCKILEGFGLKTIPASCGDEALVLQDEIDEDIDFMLTDVVMPGMNGVKLAELLTALRPEMRVVFMSGYPASGDMAPVEIPKDAIFIAKPVNYDVLAQALSEMMQTEDLTKVKADGGDKMQLWIGN